jgi:hypothetical protein
MKRILAAVCTAVLTSAIAAAQPAPGPDPYAGVARARAQLAGPAKDLWPGWDRTPFGLLLVDGEQEHLLCDDRAPAGFGPPAVEPATGCTRRSRARTFPPGLLAAMPAFGPPSVIVVGTPEATGHTAAGWSAVLLHEHFHQHQTALPDYWTRVAQLDLSGGDQTGMWMLNYPFPYAQPEVRDRFAAAGRALTRAVARPAPAEVRAYLRARAVLGEILGPRDGRYLDFQAWQEGVARWTEIAAAERSDDPALREVGRAKRAATLNELGGADLTRDKRVAFYALGAGEAMLLEACRADWKADYARHLAMSPLLNGLPTRCRGAGSARP